LEKPLKKAIKETEIKQVFETFMILEVALLINVNK